MRTAGLVGITSACAVVQPYGALAIGILSGVVYLVAVALMHRLQIDDPLESISVHFFCGCWGVLAPGFFAVPSLMNLAYNTSFFWDGGVPTLEQQAIAPIINPLETDLYVGPFIRPMGLLGLNFLEGNVRTLGDVPVTRWLTWWTSGMGIPKRKTDPERTKPPASVRAVSHIRPNQDGQGYVP